MVTTVSQKCANRSARAEHALFPAQELLPVVVEAEVSLQSSLSWPTASCALEARRSGAAEWSSQSEETTVRLAAVLVGAVPRHSVESSTSALGYVLKLA